MIDGFARRGGGGGVISGAERASLCSLTGHYHGQEIMKPTPRRTFVKDGAGAVMLYGL